VCSFVHYSSRTSGWASLSGERLPHFRQADAVLRQGVKLVPPSETNNPKLYNMYVLLAKVAQVKGDKAGQLAAVEKAEQYAGDSHPEFAFDLGSTYYSMEPQQKEKALRLLNQFTKKVCKGAQAMKFKEQCEETQSMIQKLGS